MPSSKNYVRDYKREYETQLGSTADKEKNASRKRARRAMEKKGLVRKGDGKDVDHKNGNPLDNSRNNLIVKPKSVNRSIARNRGAGKKGS